MVCCIAICHENFLANFREKSFYAILIWEKAKAAIRRAISVYFWFWSQAWINDEACVRKGIQCVYELIITTSGSFN